MGYSIDSINTLAGGTYAYDILGLNAICIAQGGTGGHTYSIDALNEICTLLGATAGHTYIIDALNAISVAIGGSGGYKYEDSAWSAIAASGIGYTPSGDEDVTMYLNARSGITLSDAYSNNATILLPNVKLSASGRNMYVADNGALDIGSSDFTLCGWIKPNQTTKSAAAYYLLGKNIAGGVNGRYGIYMNQTSGYLSCIAQSSGGAVTITNTTDFTTQGFIFFRMDVNQTTKKIRFFVNETQVGTDQSFTGTFASLGNQYEFYIGGGNSSDGSSTTFPSQICAADIYVFNKILSAGEIASLYTNRTVVSGAKAHWPLNNIYGHDCSGNGYKLSNTSLATAQDIEYTLHGSRQALDIGYSVWKKIQTVDIQVPYLDSGSVISSPVLASGYYSDADFPTKSIHNLCDSEIEFGTSGWDRSDATRFAAAARSGYYDSTSAATKKRWHISELTNFVIYNSFANTGYKGMNFIRFDAAFARTQITGILVMGVDKTGSTLGKIYDWCNENGVYTVDYAFSTDHIVAQRSNKLVRFRSNRYLEYSSDTGSNYSVTLDLNGVTSIITYAWIFDNGNILFCSQTKCYYSTDNLATYHESTTIGIDGNTFSPTSTSNFTPFVNDAPQYVTGTEVRLWGNYSINAATEYLNINVWSTVDNGLTVKSIYKANTTTVGGSAIPARHAHAVNQFYLDESFYFQTGDGTDECNWIKIVLNKNNNTATVSKVAGDNVSSSGAGNNTYFKSCGLAYFNGYIYWACDSQDSNRYGIYRVRYANLSDQTKFEKVVSTAQPFVFLTVIDGIIFACEYVTKSVFVSADGLNWTEHALTGGPDLLAGVGSYQGIWPKDSNGYYKLEIVATGEGLDAWTLGTVLKFKATIL